MEQVSIDVKIDKQLKADAEEIKEKGLKLTTAINEEEILRRAKQEKFITKTIAELEAIESE